jgi:hypothetical protein
MVCFSAPTSTPPLAVRGKAPKISTCPFWIGGVVCPQAGLVSIANPVNSQTAVDILILFLMWFLHIEL